MSPSIKWRLLVNKVFDLSWNRSNIWILFLSSAAIAVFLLGANIKAQWWVIDDHEIAYFLGSDKVLRADEIWGRLIRDTEVGQNVQLPRFRPVYYTLRLLECWAWGASPSLWYEFRILIYAFFIGSFWYLISHKVGCVIGGLISLSVAMQTYWADIFSRLGPSEVYTVLGLGVFFWGIYIVYTSNKVTGWWLLFSGVVLCSGSKENFLFLILPFLYIVWDFYKQGKLKSSRVALSLGTLIWMLWIGFMVVSLAISHGGDVYGNSVGIKARILNMVRLAGRVDIIMLLLVCAILLLYSIRLFRLKDIPEKEQDQRNVAAVIILSLIYISQIYFYNGNWPIGNRYDFPGVLVGPLLLSIFIAFLNRKTLTNDHGGFRTSLIVTSVFISSFFALLQIDHVREIVDLTNGNVEHTASFSTEIEQLVKLGMQNPDYVFIVQADHPYKDYEAVFSYFRFLRFYGTQNPITFLWTGLKPKAYHNLLESSLASDLQNLSLFGELPVTVAGNKNDFAPYSEIDGSETGCIMLLLSGEPQKECQVLVVEDWR